MIPERQIDTPCPKIQAKMEINSLKEWQLRKTTEYAGAMGISGKKGM